MLIYKDKEFNIFLNFEDIVCYSPYLKLQLYLLQHFQAMNRIMLPVT